MKKKFPLQNPLTETPKEWNEGKQVHILDKSVNCKEDLELMPIFVTLDS